MVLFYFCLRTYNKFDTGMFSVSPTLANSDGDFDTASGKENKKKNRNRASKTCIYFIILLYYFFSHCKAVLVRWTV